MTGRFRKGETEARVPVLKPLGDVTVGAHNAESESLPLGPGPSHNPLSPAVLSLLKAHFVLAMHLCPALTGSSAGSGWVTGHCRFGKMPVGMVGVQVDAFLSLG